MTIPHIWFTSGNKKTYGILLNIYNTPHILTTNDFHTTIPSHSNHINKKKLKIAAIGNDMNLMLFRIKHDIKININAKHLTISDFDTSFPESKNNSINSTQCNVNEIDFINMVSFNDPVLPRIMLSPAKLTKRNKKISLNMPLISTEQHTIKGIVSHIDSKNNIITVIPSITIVRFLREYINTGCYHGLCNIIAKTSLQQLTNKITKTKTYRIKVNNNYKINYNNNMYNPYQKPGQNLKKGDVIYKINNKSLDINETIYDDRTKSRLPLESYIALSYYSGNNIPLTILRQNKNNKNNINKTMDKLINIRSRPVNTAKYLQFRNKTLKKYIFSGLIFTELNEHMVIQHGETLVGKSFDYFYETPFRNKPKKIVVIHSLTKNAPKHFKTLGLPVIKPTNKTNIIPIVSTINNKKVHSLHELAELLNNNSAKHVIKLTLTNTQHIKLSFDSNNLFIS